MNSTARPVPTPPPFERPVRLREVRLASGLILGAFLLTHFGNHALGLVSVEAMEAGRRSFNLLWRHPVGTILLYGSLLLHFLLALQALYRRRTLRMPVREAMQLALGLSLPFLLVAHVTGTRIEFALTGHDSGYPEVVRNLWILSPGSGARQAATLLIAWLHGCLGIAFWLRPKPWFPRYGLLLYTGALVVPLLALLGFAEAGQEIAAAPERFPSAPDAREHPERSHLRLRGPRQRGSCGAGRSHLLDMVEAAARHLSRQPGGLRPAGVQRPGGQPHGGDPASFRVRRAGPVLHLPGAGARRP